MIRSVSFFVPYSQYLTLMAYQRELAHLSLLRVLLDGTC